MEGNDNQIVDQILADWLQGRGLPPGSIVTLAPPPTPIAPSLIDMDYLIYSAQSLAEKEFHPGHYEYAEGERYVYGLYWDDQAKTQYPIFGPAEEHTVYASIDDFGEPTFDPFRRTPEYEEILGQFGYTLVTAITVGDAEDQNPYDNQVWIVNKLMTEGEFAGQSVPFACKIVSIRNFGGRILPEAGRQILKEATLLLNIDHESIVKVFDNIFIEDTETRFPYLFIASVMELMEGTLLNLLENFENQVLPERECYWIFKDCAQGVDFIHNQIRSPSGAWMRVVHMAIREANILYKWDASKYRNTFKLADFEECIIYDRTFRPELWNPNDPNSYPPDVLPDPNQRPYRLPISAPEILHAQRDGVDRTHLRLMPNDVFCLSTSVLYCRTVGQRGNEKTSFFVEKLRDLLNPNRDPLPQPDTFEHLVRWAAWPDPNTRYTIKQVLAHPYLSDGRF